MKTTTALIAGLCVASLIGCSASSGRGATSFSLKREAINELEKDPVPGTVNDVWVEPMCDMVRVPGQLDKKGVTYRKASNQLVCIRPGRYQVVQYPEK